MLIKSTPYSMTGSIVANRQIKGGLFFQMYTYFVSYAIAIRDSYQFDRLERHVDEMIKHVEVTDFALYWCHYIFSHFKQPITPVYHIISFNLNTVGSINFIIREHILSQVI